MTIGAVENGTLRFDYIYDDGPGKTVRSTDRVTITESASTYRVQSADGKNDTTYAVDGLQRFRGSSGTVVLNGRGAELQGLAERSHLASTPGQLAFPFAILPGTSCSHWRWTRFE